MNADAVYRSWKGPERVVGDSANTFAEGIATRVSFDLPFSIYKQYLDDFVQLTEDELAAGVRLALQDHAQPGGRRGRGGDRGGLQAARRPGGPARRVRDVRRQHRRRQTQVGARLLMACWPASLLA